MYTTRSELSRAIERIRLSRNDANNSVPSKKRIKFAFIGIGDGGSNIACEFAELGYPTYIFNTNINELKKHIHSIPKENCILTPSKLLNNKYKGTGRDSALGYRIAAEHQNQRRYAEVMLKSEVRDANFVWITLSLGGGTGTGALSVVARILKKVRLHRQYYSSKVPFGIICSIPSKEEIGSAARENTLKGLEEIQQLILEASIGTVLIIDNEKLFSYYEHLVLNDKLDSNYIDALSYGNLATALLIVETAQFPFLSGRQCIDMMKYLNLLSTPGWLTIGKETVGSNCSPELIIQSIFELHPFLAEFPKSDYSVDASLALLIPMNSKQDFKTQDRLAQLGMVNYGVRNTAFAPVLFVEEMEVFGMRVSKSPLIKIPEIAQELQSWLEDEQSEVW